MSDVMSAPHIMCDVTPVVLLCCGSFSPVLNFHLRMFELGRDALNKTGKFEVISGIISPVNDAYGKKNLAPAKHRCAMIRHALQSSDWIRLDTWESEQSCWLETAKVLEHHQQVATAMYDADLATNATKGKMQRLLSHDQEEPLEDDPNPVNYRRSRKPVQVKLLLGADVLETFKVPGLWEDSDVETIVGKYGVVATSRDDVTAEDYIRESNILSCHKENIHLVTDWIHHSCSSTTVRDALHRGDSVKYLVDDSVIDYIYTHGLYGTGNKKRPLAERPMFNHKVTC